MAIHDLEKKSTEIRRRITALSGKADRANNIEQLGDIVHDIAIEMQNILLLIEKKEK
ncbi:hypothetical protein KY304_02225 [Candidatus Woesearchaeota archaeon]|nr:hypothetical protein [Candidatus Woesearchaeota archaeon]